MLKLTSNEQRAFITHVFKIRAFNLQSIYNGISSERPLAVTLLTTPLGISPLYTCSSRSSLNRFGPPACIKEEKSMFSLPIWMVDSPVFFDYLDGRLPPLTAPLPLAHCFIPLPVRGRRQSKVRLIFFWGGGGGGELFSGFQSLFSHALSEETAASTSTRPKSKAYSLNWRPSSICTHHCTVILKFACAIGLSFKRLLVWYFIRWKLLSLLVH